MYRIAICDDEQDAALTLKEQVAAILDTMGVACEMTVFSSGEALLAHISEQAAGFDLFLLDILMQQTSGLDTAKAIRRCSDSAAIIFTTASDRFVFSGYEVRALQYLLKPVDQQALAAALAADLRHRFEVRHLVFKLGGTTQKVAFEDIEYLESSLKWVRLVTRQGVFEIRDQISNLANSLPKPGFCRCHRGFIVNFGQVARMNAQSLTTHQGTVIPIGKTYASATSRSFLNYLGGSSW